MSLSLDHYRLLGRSGLRVSPLSLGTMTFGMPGWGTDLDEARTILGLFSDAGGNFVDTANFYAQGESERMLGELLQGRRQCMVIATKYSLAMGSGDPNASGNQRKNMMQAVEDSLRRLRTDYIDLLYLHLWDNRTPVEEILRAFDDLVRAGKVLYIGISDTPAWQVSRMQAIAELRGWSPFIALQVPYNLTERTVEREFMPMAQEMGIGVLPWSPLAGGVLSGKYRKEDLGAQPVTDSARRDINLATGRLTQRALDIAAVLGEVAAELGHSSAQVALAWTLSNPAVSSPIIGARNSAQLKDNLGALEVSFSAEQLHVLEAASDIGTCFPYDMIDTPKADLMLGGYTVEPRKRR